MSKQENLQTTKYTVMAPASGDRAPEAIAEIDVKYFIDEDGDEILTPESLRQIDEIRARHHGILSPEDIRNLREQDLKLTQSELSDLIGCGKKSLSRWENGKGRPSPIVNLVLRALKDRALDVNYLRSLQQPEFGWVYLASGTRATSTYAYRSAYLQTDRMNVENLILS